MHLLLLFSLLTVLVALFLQDWRNRLVWWGLFPILAGLMVWSRLETVRWEVLLYETGLNFLILVIQWLAVAGWYSFKLRRWEPVIGKLFGWGDAWFLLVLCTAFSPVNYWLIYLGGIAFVGGGYGLLRVLKLVKKPQVPLAGGLALLVAAILIAFWAEPQWQHFGYQLAAKGGVW